MEEANSVLEKGEGAKCSDQQIGGAPPVWSGAHPYLSSAHPFLSGAHPYLSGADFKIMKVCSIILFIVMTLALPQS